MQVAAQVAALHVLCDRKAVQQPGGVSLFDFALMTIDGDLTGPSGGTRNM